MVLHAADSVYKDAMVPANSRHVGPNLALNFFGYHLAATRRAENDVLVVLGEGVRHVPPLPGLSILLSSTQRFRAGLPLFRAYALDAQRGNQKEADDERRIQRGTDSRKRL